MASSNLSNGAVQRPECLVFFQRTRGISRGIIPFAESELVTPAAENLTPSYRSGNAICLLFSLSA
jgi:hypothetical protein